MCSNQFTFGSQNFADIDGIFVIICADRIGYDGDGMGVVSLVSVFEGKSAWNWLLLNHVKTYKAHQVQHDYVTMYVQRNSIQGSAAVQLCLEAVCTVAVRKTISRLSRLHATNTGSRTCQDLFRQR